jgi:transposase
MATLVATRWNPVIRQFYQRLRAAGKAPKPDAILGRRMYWKKSTLESFLKESKP